MILAQSGSIGDDYWWWPVVPVLAGALMSALVAWAVYRAGRRNAVDKEARETHRAVTTGPGADARAFFSAAEYEWWNNKRSLRSQERTGGDRDVPDDQAVSMGSEAATEADFQAWFYVLGASLDQLVAVLGEYDKSGGGRSLKYRRLLAWHAGMHIAWMTWFIGAKSVADSPPPSEVHPRLSGAWGRVQDALEAIGDHHVELRKPDVSDDWPIVTIKDFAKSELAGWLDPPGAAETEGDATSVFTQEKETVRQLAVEGGLIRKPENAGPDPGEEGPKSPPSASASVG